MIIDHKLHGSPYRTRFTTSTTVRLLMKRLTQHTQKTLDGTKVIVRGRALPGLP